MSQLQKTTEDAIAIFQAGVHAVQADRLVRERLSFDGKQMQIDDSGEKNRWQLHQEGRLIVVGAGKATFGMLKGLSISLRGLDSEISVAGHVNVPEGTTTASENDPISDKRANSVTVLAARPAGVNEPTELAVRGTKKIIELCEGARPIDTVLFLLSGGASALLTSPIEGITLAEKVQTTRLLSHYGAAIEELNAVRRGLSTVKAGGLANRCRAGRLITLVISDVLGDSLATIGSGPTWVNNPPNISEIREILLKYDKNQSQFPRAVYQTLARLASEESSSRSQNWLTKRFAKKHDQQCELVHIVLANNATAVDAAGVEAVRLGYAYWMESARQSEGAAEDVGRRLARQCIGLKNQPNISCIISGGEPTVTLPEESRRGRGGRNQQLTLAALNELEKLGATSSDWERMTVLSGGTDGEDGPTDAAGAWCDAQTVASYRDQKLSPQSHLERCDAYPFFKNTDSLLITGPTHTNVCDLRVAIYDQTQ
jgi:glycerate 2-kinase